MKRILLFLLFLIGLSAFKASAQMGQAQTIKWDVSKEVTLNMPQDELWDMLRKPEMLKKAANGYLTSIVITDPTFPVSRNLVFSDGSKRTETVKQLDEQYKFMVIQLGTASLPQGVTEAEIAIFTKAKENQSSISWMAKIVGKDEGKKSLMAQLTTEFDNYAAGFEKMTKKSIPATRMN
jgi:carbon monoxide dehydrogenase subunit G